MYNDKQTVVEWLLEELTYDNGDGQRWGSFKETVDLTEYFEKAKAMHKEEITHAYHHSWYFRDHPYETAEKYYNETFGGNNE